ncbi:hypothetical protein C8R46DRAFT_1067637, partial [Mycena filopes]
MPVATKFASLARMWALQMAPRTQRVAAWDTYRAMLARFRADKDIFLNIGCGTGNVTYRAIQDGIPPLRTLSVDKDKNLWDYGRIVQSYDESAAVPEEVLQDVPFLAGDLLDEKFLPRLPFSASEILSAHDSDLPPVDLTTLTTLAPLHHRVSAIFAERFFHLFPFEQQKDIARRLAPLLIRERGAMVFGRQLGGKAFVATQDDEDLSVFLHSQESWRKMWEEAFPEGEVQVDMSVIPRPRSPETSNLWWSV